MKRTGLITDLNSLSKKKLRKFIKTTAVQISRRTKMFQNESKMNQATLIPYQDAPDIQRYKNVMVHFLSENGCHFNEFS